MPDGKHPLDYATPPAEAEARRRTMNKARGVVLAVASVPLGLFGLFMLMYGVIGLVEIIERPPPRIDRPGDFGGLAIMLLLGLFCLFVFIRWLNGGMRMARTGELRRRRF